MTVPTGQRKSKRRATGNGAAPRRGKAAREGFGSGERNILLALGWYYPEMHRGVARFARDHHWHITADFDDLVPKHWQGDGVLTLLGAQQDIWRRLRRFHVPIVDLAESRPNIALPRATMDNAAIGRMAADHLLDRGYRNFAYLQRWDLGVSRRRRDAFKAALNEADQRCEVLCWQRERGKTPDARDQRHRWLMRRLGALPKPLALFAARDTEAVEAIEASLSAGLDVPEQVAVLGVDNTETICDCLRVPLSSIDANLERVGYEGAALLERLLQGDRAPAGPIYVPPASIVERRSTDNLAVEHPRVLAALRFIHDHAHQQIGTMDVVRHVGMSRSGLEKAFREHHVRSPMAELRHVRLVRAKKLLVESDRKVGDIARRAGFQTPHNLCRAFRQSLGATPRQYRQAHREGDAS